VAFLDIIKTVDVIFFDGPNYKLAINNFPSYLVDNAIAVNKYYYYYYYYYIFGISKRPSKQPHSIVRHGAGVSQGGIISPVLFSLYINDTPIPSYHAELSPDADNTAILNTSRQAALLVTFTDLYLSD